MMYPYETVGICILFISLCLLCSSTSSFVDVLKVSRAILSGLQEKFHSNTGRPAVIGEHRTLYRLIVDVPAEHLNLFKTNPPLDLNSLSLVVKETFVV